MKILRDIWFSVVLLGLPLSLIHTPPAEVVDVKIWPKSVQVNAGESVEFYTAVLRADGTTDCHPDPLLPGCDSAVARLDVSKLSFQPTVVFTWPPVSNAGEFDSLFYGVYVYQGNTEVWVDTVRHPDTTTSWSGGAPGTSYTVEVWSAGFKAGIRRDSEEGSPVVTFVYPSSLPVPARVDTVVVDTVY